MEQKLFIGRWPDKMPINYNPFKEGDPLDAASLNDKFSAAGGAGTGVNNLSSDDIDRYALRQEHLPAIVNGDFTNLVALGPVTTTTYTYANNLNENASPVASYQVMGSQLGTTGAAAPYGPSVVPATDVGWRIPAIPEAAAPFYSSPAEIEFTAQDANSPYSGILVHFSIALVTAYLPRTLIVSEPLRDGAVVSIGIQDSAGNRAIIERSIKWYSQIGHFQGSLDTFTYIKKEEWVALTNNNIVKVFGAIAVGNHGTPALNDTRPLIVREHQLTIIPIRAGTLQEA